MVVSSYRSDLEEAFSLNPRAYASLLENLDSVMSLWLQSESKGGPSLAPDSFSNWAENVADIKNRLETLRKTPVLKARPLLLHLDVAAMYPNIILTHRLQPSSIKTPQQCRECPWFDRGSPKAAAGIQSQYYACFHVNVAFSSNSYGCAVC